MNPRTLDSESLHPRPKAGSQRGLGYDFSAQKRSGARHAAPACVDEVLFSDHEMGTASGAYARRADLHRVGRCTFPRARHAQCEAEGCWSAPGMDEWRRVEVPYGAYWRQP